MKNERTTRSNQERSISTTVLLTIIGLVLTCIGGAYALGNRIGKNEDYKERMDCLEQKKELLSQIDLLKFRMDSIQEIPQAPFDIFINGRLGEGLDMGIDTYRGVRDWVDQVNSNGELCISYPAGQVWGAVFITAGKPVPSKQRKGRDFSKYAKLVLELKGNKGATVEVGLKDNLDPDNGNETKVALTLQDKWETYVIDLNRFTNADLKNLYVVTEFVFAENPVNLCVRKIQLQ